MRAAVIDIGSNSIKLAIGEDHEGHVKQLEMLKNVYDAGKSSFYRGRISSGTMKETIGILSKYRQLAEGYQINELKVIATTAVREAVNKDVFLDTIRRQTGFSVEVLNVGDVVYYIDAFLTYYLKQSYPLHEKNVLIAEIGAGTLDISLMEKGFTLMNLGVPVGTLRLKQFKNKVGGSYHQVYQALEEYVEKQVLGIRKTLPDIKIDDIIVIDESYASAFPKVLPKRKQDGNFFKLPLRDVLQFYSVMTEGNLDDLAYKFKLNEDIGDTVDVYALVLSKLYKLCQKKQLHLLQTSLSEAILANILFGVEIGKKYDKTNQLISVARFLCQKYGADLKHSKHVAFVCELMFNQMKEILGLRDEELIYLQLAAYLHNVGLYISNRAHHKHSEYIINSLNFFRLTDSEIKIIACIARYHRKATPQKTHFLFNSLSLEEQILVQKLSSIIRIANALDSSHNQKVKDIRLKATEREDLILEVVTDRDFGLEKITFDEKKSLFEEISGVKLSLKLKKG